MKKKPKLEILKDLFWDYKWESVVKNLDSPFVIARVLEIGNKKQVKEFISCVSSQKIIEFLIKYEKLLSKQSLNFWRLVYGVKKEKFT
ncbi:MAG: hypothetical protein NC816_06730 [Candidatus Omnitrophica bacterium]|nr:hypothetical protein [Candidatus Omnitrophota bacterium]MCM8809758.1 hypothetical protein [Candidatus Omnitrophota bacterium]MCM8810571.1 hypothetical protein [Candidatus Omnitrophota bacterium]MCM8833593.1 hypothetical protein [Candidatus Omnitrophota bacterium]